MIRHGGDLFYDWSIRLESLDETTKNASESGLSIITP